MGGQTGSGSVLSWRAKGGIVAVAAWAGCRSADPPDLPGCVLGRLAWAATHVPAITLRFLARWLGQSWCVSVYLKVEVPSQLQYRRSLKYSSVSLLSWCCNVWLGQTEGNLFLFKTNVKKTNASNFLGLTFANACVF